MRLTWEWIVAAAALIVILMLVWFVGPMTTLEGSNLWILRVGILLLGLLGTGGFLWWAASNKPAIARPQAPQVRMPSASDAAAAAGAAFAGPPGSPDEIDALVREAASKLAASRLGRTATLGALPAIFLVGESGSAKTSAVVQGGLDAELLAGQIYNEGQMAPTASANLWLARRTIFAEAGGRMINDSALWARLVKRLAPKRFGSVFGKKQQAPRAAVVCVDCERFLKPGATEAVTASAQKLRARLGEISQVLGISFPVYVLFNRLDTVPSFKEFVEQLSKEEAVQVLGMTLPYHSSIAGGVYAEQENRRLSTAFNSLFNSLCDWRLSLLARERDRSRQPGAYEFPREFRKLRNFAVQFMVDLNRPSQLRTAPFLRGFYFTGLRQVSVSSPSSQTMVAPAAAFQPVAAPASATTILKKDEIQALLQAEMQGRGAAQAAESRQMTQSVFLTHIFSHVILQDQAALGASGASTRVSGLQRVLLWILIATAGIFAAGFTVSFFSNRALQSRVLTAARNAPAEAVPAGQLAGEDALTRLDALRVAIEELNGHARDGAPWRMRWGLYSGDSLRAEARRVYFARFSKLLFGQTQSLLLARLSALPVAPQPADEYGPVYDTLKAYLITTSNPDKSTREFMTPVLMRTWAGVATVEEPKADLAGRQFGFYADELFAGNPYSSSNDTAAIAKARAYLTQFAATQRIYAAMRADASKNNPSLSFNKKYPGASAVVINNVEVEGAMTKAGFAFMQEALKRPEKYFGGEEWVLGSQAAAGVDMAKLTTDLTTMYQGDYIKQWRDFLARSAVVRYGSLRDASSKLTQLSANTSPLLAVFCEVSYNTAVENPAIQKAFQPVQQVVPPACQGQTVQFVQGPNQPYMGALLQLQSCLDQAATQLETAPADQRDAVKGQCVPGAAQAKVATRQIAQGLQIDQEVHIERTVQKLMEDPITAAEGLLRPAGPADAGGLCSAFRTMVAKYPFNSASSARASLDEVSAFFGPGGAMAAFYEQNLKEILLNQGGRYFQNPASQFRVNPQFQAFWDRAASVQRAIYPAAAQAPQYRFTLRPVTTEGIQSITLIINGQTQRWSGGSFTNPATFTWPGGVQSVSLSARLTGGSELNLLNYDGLWAAFQFFGDADRTSPAAGGFRMEWIPKISGQPMRLPNGQPLRLIFDVDSGATPAIFQKGYFAGFNCVSRVTR
ncbi:MAG: ImcF-related family protein [Candidatus Acidiferrales bacterium]